MSNPKTSVNHPHDLKSGLTLPPPPPWEWGYLLQSHPLAHCSMTSTQMVTAVKEKRDKYKVASILQGLRLPIIITLFSQDSTVQHLPKNTFQKQRLKGPVQTNVYTRLHSQSPSLVPLSPSILFSAQMGLHQQRQINCIAITFLTRNIFLMNWQVLFLILKNNLMVTKSSSEKKCTLMRQWINVKKNKILWTLFLQRFKSTTELFKSWCDTSTHL